MSRTFQITLTREDAAVLLRCLNYGEVAVSQYEEKNGIAESIRSAVARIRKKVTDKVAQDILQDIFGEKESA